MERINIGVLGSARGSSLQPVMDAIEQKQLDAQIRVVISPNNDAGILTRALHHGSKAVYAGVHDMTREAYDAQLTKFLREYDVDIVLLVGYMRILSAQFVQAWQHRIINVHPSLLPKHKGLMDLAVHQAVLDAGESEAGCSVHYVTEVVDDGPVLVQKSCRVDENDNAQSLKAKVQSLEGPALIEAIQLIQKTGIYYESPSLRH